MENPNNNNNSKSTKDEIDVQKIQNQEILKTKIKIRYPHSNKNVSIWMDNWTKEKDNEKDVPTPSPELKQKWRRQQTEMSKRIKLTNDFDWTLDPSQPSKLLKYVGGVDISFAKNNSIDACASIVICSYPSMEIVWECYSMIKLKLPYVVGLLAFREVPHIIDMLKKLKAEAPEFYPQLIMIDGNGYLHMRGLGQACHLGLIADIPCLGVAKKLLVTDGINDERVNEAFKASSKSADAHSALLIGDSGERRAIAYRYKHSMGTSILYVSHGHRIDLPTSLAVVKSCCKGNQLPEPVFQADHLSREFLYLNYKNLQ